MTTEMIDQDPWDPWVDDPSEPAPTAVTKHKGPVLLRRAAAAEAALQNQR